MFEPLRDPDLQGRRLDPLEAQLLAALARCPFASVADLSVWLMSSSSRVARRLDGLAQKGLVASAEVHLGKTHRRWWLVSDLGSRVLPARLRLHPPHHLIRMLSNLRFVAEVYSVCSDIVAEGGGDLIDCWWPSDTPFEAAARFSDGWVVFYWSGIWQVGSRTADRITRSAAYFPPDPSGGSGHLWPARLCFIVPDSWQGRLVSDAADSSGLADRLHLRVLDDELVYGDLVPVSSPEWLTPLEAPPGARHLSVATAFARSLYADVGGRTDRLALAALEQWPAQIPSVLARLAGAHLDRTCRSLFRLVDSSLAYHHDDGVYAPSDLWLRRAAARDRVTGRAAVAQSGEEYVSKHAAGRRKHHERGLARLMGRFRSAGCPVAVGWRGVEYHGRDGSVNPDGLVFLRSTPYGSDWFYVEYERRATQPSGVAHKLRLLTNPSFRPAYPLIVVCRPEAVRHFIDFTRGFPVLVGTTTDVATGDVVGPGPTVWFADGEPVPGVW